MSLCRLPLSKWRPLVLALLLPLLAQQSSQLELNCTAGSDLPPVGPGVDQLTLRAVAAASGAAAPTSCRLSVTSATGSGRWYLKIDPVSRADGDLVVRHGTEVIAWNGIAQLSSEILARQLTQAGDFSLDLTVRTGQLTLNATLVSPSACPPESDGWSMPWSGGCLMASDAIINALSFSDAQRACERVGANLFTTTASDASAWALSYLFFHNRLRPGFGYWVGARLTTNGDWAYINGSRLLVDSNLPPYKYDCGQSVAACQCALFREAQLYRSDCSDQRPYICSAPPGGAHAFYSALGVPCVDCRDSGVVTVLSGVVAESDNQMYFAMVGICAFILAAITAGVMACFVHSVRRWKLDAKLASRRPPAYEVGDGPQSFQMQPVLPTDDDLASEPPDYDTYVAESGPADASR